MSKTVAIINQKGGVAKTTTALNLGVTLSLLKAVIDDAPLPDPGIISGVVGI